MQRYKIKIEYEGTPFVGWQFQKNGQSVQEVLQKAILNFSKEKVVVTGAGRTDSPPSSFGRLAPLSTRAASCEKSCPSGKAETNFGPTLRTLAGAGPRR